MTQIGDICNLPMEERPDADRKLERPWLLMHTPSTETPNWAFAYGSTQKTEEKLGATALVLAWTYADSGKLTQSRFFPARLRLVVAGDTLRRAGWVDGADDRIREGLRAALGIGEGPGSRGDGGFPERGRVVRLTNETMDVLDGARYAVVVTRNDYAMSRRYQLLVPVYDADEVEPQAGEIESEAAWVKALPGGMGRAILSVSGLITGSERNRPFNPPEIAGLTAVTLDRATLDEIDAALVKHFDIDQPTERPPEPSTST